MFCIHLNINRKLEIMRLFFAEMYFWLLLVCFGICVLRWFDFVFFCLLVCCIICNMAHGFSSKGKLLVVLALVKIADP